MWDEKEFIDPFNENEKYFWMKIEELGRYYFARDEINKTNYLSPRVCDLGCANGYGTRILKEVAKDVVGLDINDKSLNVAKSKNIDGISYQKVDFEKEIKDCGKFDYIVSFETLEHLSNIDNVLTFIKNSLRDTGLVICSLPNPEFESVDENGKPLNNFHKRTYKKQDVIEIFGKYGFELSQIYSQPYPNIFSKLESKLARKNKLTLNSADDKIFKDIELIKYFAQIFARPTTDMEEKSYSFIYLFKKRL